LIDQNDSFYFGFSKLDVMFGFKPPESIRLFYDSIQKPGVRFCREAIIAIDPVAKRVTTDKGTHEADVLVIALGANYDMDATPGLAEGGNEFYTLAGATKLRNILPNFSKGHVIVGVASAPFKCPPAPSEAALLTHDHLVKRGVRDQCEISLVMPFGLPIPPSPDTSKALLYAFQQRGIKFIAKRNVSAIDASRHMAILNDGAEMPFDLFLGIPKHRVPVVVEQSGLTVNGWIPVDPKNLKTDFPNVYAVGDVTSVGTPKAGVFAEGAAKVAADSIIAEFENAIEPSPFLGDGSCYIEFGQGKVGRVDVNFFSGPTPTGIYREASEALVTEKKYFGSSRAERWFGTEFS
jgi:sulfide:quinone oxidoreductase